MSEKSQYKTLSEWKKNHPRHYAFAYRNNMIDKLCKMFGWEKFSYPKTSRKRRKSRKKSFWTKENIIKEVSKYDKRGQWCAMDSVTYRIAKENGWLDEIYALRGWKRNKRRNITNKPSGYWDVKENVLLECNNYFLLREWRLKSPGSFQSAKRNGWMDECKVIIKKCYDDMTEKIFMNL